MKKAINIVKRWIPDALVVLGAACIVVGGFLVCAVAGWIVLGVVLIAAAIILSRSDGT